MSRDVVTEFGWSDRMEKGAFRKLKNIQIVLLSAMVRVDPDYTLYQFENEIKLVLTKCTNTLKKERKSENIATAMKSESIITNSDHAEAQTTNENETVDGKNNENETVVENNNENETVDENNNQN